MFKKKFIFYILFLFIACSNKIPENYILTGKYKISLNNKTKEFQIDKNQQLGFNFIGTIKITYNFSPKVNNKSAILKCGRVNEALQVYFNDSLIGTGGIVKPIPIINNWSYNLFYIPHKLIKKYNIITYLIKSNSYYIGFRDSLPMINFIKNSKKDKIIKEIILKYINSNEENYKTYYIKSKYCIADIKPESLSIELLSKKEDTYIFNIKLKYNDFIRIFIDSINIQYNDITLKQPYYYTNYYYSKELGLYQPYGVYLPHDYFNNKEKKYPVVYAFGGGSEVHKTFIQGQLPQLYDKYIANNTCKSFILISIQGSIGANFFYNDITKLNYERSFISELIPVIEHKFHIDTTKRAIIGLSKGGMAAFSIGIRHKTLFKKIVSISGTLTSPNNKMVEKNPFYIIKNLKNTNNLPDIFITAGNTDEYKLNIVAENFHNLLLLKNIKHKYKQFDGGHHHNEWFSILPEILKFVTIY